MKYMQKCRFNAEYLTASLFYGKSRKIPTPEIYVFYDGSKDLPLESELKLSDAFIEKCDKLYLELSVRVINVNYEKGAELLKKCRTLSEYSQLIHIAKANYERTKDRDTAVSEAVAECMEKNILRDFLKENGGEIMSFLYDILTKEEMEEIREHDGYVKGHAEGVQEGKAERDRDIAVNMLAMDIDIPVIAKATGLSESDISKLRQDDPK